MSDTSRNDQTNPAFHILLDKNQEICEDFTGERKLALGAYW